MLEIVFYHLPDNQVEMALIYNNQEQGPRIAMSKARALIVAQAMIPKLNPKQFEEWLNQAEQPFFPQKEIHNT